MRGRGQGLAARSVASRGGSGGRASARIIHSQSVLRRGHRRALNMIIVSESSAKATQLVRTSRYTLARSRGSAALNDIPRYAEVQAISVHTEEDNRTETIQCLRRASLRDVPRLGAKVVGHQVARVPRHVGAESVAGQTQGSRSFSRRVLHLDPCAWPAVGRIRRRDGIPASAPPVLGRPTPRVPLACH
jgi:hypothetical protein